MGLACLGFTVWGVSGSRLRVKGVKGLGLEGLMGLRV